MRLLILLVLVYMTQAARIRRQVRNMLGQEKLFRISKENSFELSELANV